MANAYRRRSRAHVPTPPPDSGHLVDLAATAVRVVERVHDAHQSNETANAVWIVQELARGVAAHVRQVDATRPATNVGQFSHWR